MRPRKWPSNRDYSGPRPAKVLSGSTPIRAHACSRSRLSRQRWRLRAFGGRRYQRWRILPSYPRSLDTRHRDAHHPSERGRGPESVSQSYLGPGCRGPLETKRGGLFDRSIFRAVNGIFAAPSRRTVGRHKDMQNFLDHLKVPVAQPTPVERKDVDPEMTMEERTRRLVEQAQSYHLLRTSELFAGDTAELSELKLKNEAASVHEVRPETPRKKDAIKCLRYRARFKPEICGHTVNPDRHEKTSTGRRPIH